MDGEKGLLQIYPVPKEVSVGYPCIAFQKWGLARTWGIREEIVSAGEFRAGRSGGQSLQSA